MSSTPRARRVRRGAAAGGVALVALATGLANAPQVNAAPDPGGRATFKRIDVDKLGLTFTPRSESNKKITVMLQMTGEPVVTRNTPTRKADVAASKSLRGAQDKIKGGISSAGGKVVAQLQWAYNGVQVTVPEKNVAKLANLPGVIAVRKVHTFKPANVNGVPYVGGPQTWQATGKTGKGVKIANIDTGVDYTHADFGGPGTVEAFKAADRTDTQPADPAYFGPNAPKVKGGYDLVGDDYDANDPASVPKPDPNPLDCNGHGSHTAGSSAGFGVTKDGKRYAGPYNADTIKNNQWNVGPGVAPEADIYAYRVFGCEGSSNVVAEAIDRAVADGVDVISMSLGSDLGGVDDPTTVAAENATAAGITVVAAAGNAGNNAYMLSSPASGNHVLSVAALDGSQAEYPGARLNLSTGKTVDAIDANGAPLPSGSLPVKVLRTASGDISLGCDPAEYKGVTGALVITKRGTCARVARAVLAQKAGAKAALMINSDQSTPPYEGPITSNPDTGEAYDVTIPFLGVGATSDNVTKLLEADGKTTTLTAIQVPNSSYRQSASFTSGGPRNPDSAPKPEVIAPGVSVASAGVGTGNGYLVESGTSMATPMTAGAAALVKQAHPTWGATQIKAVLQNTADPKLNTPYDVRLAGTGEVQAQNATTSDVLATTADGLNSLAFGFAAGSGTVKVTKTFTLTNTGSSAAPYDLSVQANGDQRGAQVAVSPSQVTVPAGKTQDVKVTLTMSKEAFAALPSDSTSSVGVGKVISVAGNVVATPLASRAGQRTVRMAYMVVPRGLSAVTPGTPTAWQPAKGSGGTFTSSLPVTNNGIHSGTADVYAWGIKDGADTGRRSMDVRAAGVQTLPGDALGGTADDRSLVFAVSGWGQATNHSVDEFDIAIDSDKDGATDYYVLGIDLGAVLTGSFDGRFGSITVDANTGDVIDAFVAEAPMNGSVVELPALASELGLSSSKSGFTYSVTGFSVLDSTLVDTSARAGFDAWKPALSTGQFADLQPGQSAQLPLTLDRGKQQSTPGTLGWLVVGVDDASGAPQADQVPAPTNLGGR
jgi:minor extracellular serine protease Vpr